MFSVSLDCYTGTNRRLTSGEVIPNRAIFDGNSNRSAAINEELITRRTDLIGLEPEIVY